MIAPLLRPVPLAGINEKVAFLRRARSYGPGTEAVECVETHMAWVFLTDTRAYKLKKPVRYPFLDFSTIEARRRHCEEEVRLNRRLAPGGYLGVVPLVQRGDGGLGLGDGGAPVDWLVEMRRLPSGQMLDQAIRDGTWRVERLEAVGRLLADFFGRADPERLTPECYRESLLRETEENRDELLREPRLVSAHPLARAVAGAQTEILRAWPGLFDARVRQRRVVEGHGDLRPEHICLGPPPVVIDCIEFNRGFRIHDAADELSYLRLECERLGGERVGAIIYEAYCRAAQDAPTAGLMHFYMSHRALLRAKIAAWHLRDAPVPDSSVWTRRARAYLALAAKHVRAVPAPR